VSSAAGAAAPHQGWADAPCALATLALDGTVLEANATLLEWVGRSRGDVEGRLRLSDLLSVGARIYWETHLSPVLHVDGRVDEVAVDLDGPRGRQPVLLTAVARSSAGVVQVAMTSARERWRYERDLLAARRTAERSAGQVRVLQEATAALSRALGVDGVTRAVLAAAVGSLGAAGAALWLADARGALALRGSSGSPPATDPSTPPAGALLDGAALDGAALLRAGGVLVPLRGQAALQGVLHLAPRDDPASDPPDLEVLTAVGQQTGLALDRAHLYEQSASVARELQHSLLAVSPPEDGRFAVATAYRPGVAMLEVGGDWYDTFWAEDGVLAVVVGDVVGRGLRAASAMGQLRSAVRAVAAPGVGPARLLSRLDRFVEPIEAAGMATVAYAEVDLDTGRVRYACAGHPPPVLVPRCGPPRLLWDGRSVPLGAFGRVHERSEAEVDLSPGDRLLLYTDGLFERRERPLEVGLEVLAHAAAAGRGAPPAEHVAGLTATMLRDERVRDDVCVLLLDWPGPPFSRRLSADLRELSALRHELADWLAAQGADDAARDDLVLAASEATANAAEHGSGGRPEALVRVGAHVEDGVVVLAVHDEGRWRPPVPSVERGRGLGIIRALVGEVSVETGSGTTVVVRRALRGERP